MTPAEYKTIRKKLGLTQAGLAALLVETREIVNRRETGVVPIEPRAAWALLGVQAHTSANTPPTPARKRSPCNG